MGGARRNQLMFPSWGGVGRRVQWPGSACLGHSVYCLGMSWFIKLLPMYGYCSLPGLLWHISPPQITITIPGLLYNSVCVCVCVC